MGTRGQEEAKHLTLRVLEALGLAEPAAQVGVRLWDGTRWPDDDSRPATLVLRHAGAARQMFLPGTELGMAEAYLYDDFDIEGEVEAVFDLAEALDQDAMGIREKLGLARDLMRLPAGNRDAAAGPGWAAGAIRRRAIARR